MNGTGDIAGNDERTAVRQAFALWQNATYLTFREVTVAADADIRILREANNHGDGFPFDNQNGVLAHAFFPPPNNGALAGDLHFDEDENWTTNTRTNTFAQPIDLVTVAAHEIGHSLGLDHTNVAGSLMWPDYLGSHRFLGPDDIAGIRTYHYIIQQHAYHCESQQTGSLLRICLPREQLRQCFQRISYHCESGRRPAPSGLFAQLSG